MRILKIQLMTFVSESEIEVSECYVVRLLWVKFGGASPRNYETISSVLRRDSGVVLGSQGRSDFENKTLKYLAKAYHVRVNLRHMIRRKILRVQSGSTTSLPRAPHRKQGVKWIRLSILMKFSKEISGFKPVFYNLLTLNHILTLLTEKKGVCSLQCRD